MSKNLQYRLNQYEVVPPATCWTGIAERLESEYNQEDIDLAERLTAGTAPVPAAAWNKIVSALDEDVYRAEETTTLSPQAPVRRMAIWQRIAAVLLLAVAVTFLYRYGTSPDTRQVQPAEFAAISPVVPTVPAPAEENFKTSDAVESAPRQTPRRRNIVRAVSNTQAAPADDEPAVTDMRYATVDDADKRITSFPISIPTEPIRDQDGNIILDEKLVSSPDNNYVTVTGPNGEQTRMSKKFMRALSYMNAGNTEEEQMGVMLQESALWKWLFQEWRTRLIQESTFIPSSTNFLDILEMKDLLHDNL